ncbi:hypothetical protein [Tunturiibacter gelidiferens]|uniref:hypothetical protein n=1 Tax=Tunturiibacter gelidiferens TaxID=3069689 RepID=UPI003D9B57F8
MKIHLTCSVLEGFLVSRGKSAKAATEKAKFAGLMTFLAILGGVTGVVSIGLTLWFAYTGGNLRSPSLEFGFGAQKALFGGDLRKTGLSKNGPVQYLVIGSTQAENNQRSLFLVPFYLKNSGSRSLHDVMVRMTYPGRVFPPFSKISIDQNHVFMPNPEYAKFRTRTVVGDSEVVEYTFPVLRPGEGYVSRGFRIAGRAVLDCYSSFN